MTSTARNAPCPCGSAKKYKLCCLPSDAAAQPTATPEAAAKSMRSNAFKRLVEFAGKPQFRSAVQSAYDGFWSAAFWRRPKREQDEAFARPEAEGGMITYLMLDVPVALGATVAEQFLAQQGRLVPSTEFDYLQRLAATRMHLFRIDEIRRDVGLTCTDLWTHERSEIREQLLTHDVAVNGVVAARAFSAVDGATEFDGAVYAFNEADARKIIAKLRAEWNAARKRDPDLNEGRFLKQRSPVVINRFWFDRVFFTSDTPSVPRRRVNAIPAARPTDPAVNVDPSSSTTNGSFQITDSKIRRFAALLASAATPTTMPLDRLHGFLSAIMCAPAFPRPAVWLPQIWGEMPVTFDSQAEAERFVGALFVVANTIAEGLADGTFVPLLPKHVRRGENSVAQGWCRGFLAGMALDDPSWAPLHNDKSDRMLLVPIRILADPGSVVDDTTPDAQATADFEQMLPMLVVRISNYWRATLDKRNQNRARRTATTVHRLKITLDGIRPAIWRRIEIASDAKLPFLSRALIAGMGWNDTHLHAFRCDDIVYGVPDPDFDTMRDERTITLAQIAPRAKDRFAFDYDFGDGWEHTVVVEAIVSDGDAQTPRCIAGARACPPDDCGGVPGYRDLVRVLNNPAHKEHAAMRRWAGRNFAPNTFDIDATNVELRRLVRRRRAQAR